MPWKSVVAVTVVSIYSGNSAIEATVGSAVYVNILYRLKCGASWGAVASAQTINRSYKVVLSMIKCKTGMVKYFSINDQQFVSNFLLNFILFSSFN